MIRFACPCCRVTIRAAAQLAGQHARCPHCSAAFKVPPAESRTLPPPKGPHFLGKR